MVVRHAPDTSLLCIIIEAGTSYRCDSFEGIRFSWKRWRSRNFHLRFSYRYHMTEDCLNLTYINSAAAFSLPYDNNLNLSNAIRALLCDGLLVYGTQGREICKINLNPYIYREIMLFAEVMSSVENLLAAAEVKVKVVTMDGLPPWDKDPIKEHLQKLLIVELHLLYP
ncbi:hypothetical protein GIB67_028294 [Kingdonia uniflora]|uniref:Uncharacterized protein n=1 Tax=Kingdonia uniflora TaxID=39325 RepID=A0A7J7MHW5_9MAGN|nr:hypothetical protein GIB67_028294 [Kingdonia uniflora]